MGELSEHIISAPVVVLTGAGASVHLGKPTTAEFVPRVQAEVIRELGREGRRELRRSTSGEGGGAWDQIVQSCNDRWGTGTVDIEMILEHVRAQLEAMRTMIGDRNLRGLLHDATPTFSLYEAVQKVACRLVVEEYSDVDPAKANQLYGPLFAGVRAQFGVQTLSMFTLNYDVAVERATTALGLRLVDGIRRAAPADNRWSAEEFGSYAPRDDLAVVLFKLHGSTTWAWDKAGSLVELPFGTGKDPGTLTHALLYPYLTQKDLQKEPFKTGYAYLEACLGRAQCLAIIGTSLRDQHLVRILRAALETNPDLAVAVLDPAMDTDRLTEILGASPSVMAVVPQAFDPHMGGLLPGYLTSALQAGRRRARRHRPPPTSPGAAGP